MFRTAGHFYIWENSSEREHALRHSILVDRNEFFENSLTSSTVTQEVQVVVSCIMAENFQKGHQHNLKIHSQLATMTTNRDLLNRTFWTLNHLIKHLSYAVGKIKLKVRIWWKQPIIPTAFVDGKPSVEARSSLWLFLGLSWGPCWPRSSFFDFGFWSHFSTYVNNSHHVLTLLTHLVILIDFMLNTYWLTSLNAFCFCTVQMKGHYHVSCSCQMSTKRFGRFVSIADLAKYGSSKFSLLYRSCWPFAWRLESKQGWHP